MSKVIQSPVKKFAGTVTLSDPLTLPQAIAVEEAIEAGKELLQDNPSATQNRYNQVLLPGLLACVEKIDIQGMEHVTADTWPGTPKKSAAELTAWLTREVVSLFQEDDAVPNV